VRGFYYSRDEGAAFTPHAAPFDFFLLSVVNNMYLGHNTIKIICTTPGSTTGFFQRLQRGPGKSYFSKATQGYSRESQGMLIFPRYPRDHQRDLGNLIIFKDI